MKPLLLTAGVLGIGLWVALQAQAPATPAMDPIIRAMHDEIERSRQLALPNLEKPYFIEYLLDDGDGFSVSASLGGLTSRRRDRFRNLDVHMRVGDYKFDNTNYVGSDFNYGTRYDLERFPLENAYPVIRRYLWLATDTAYKSAVEAISRKRAAQRNLTLNEQVADFAHAQPVHILRDLPKLNVDEDAWTTRVRRLSSIFDRYQDIDSSSVEFNAGDGGYYLVNSEGTEVRVPDRTTYLRVRAAAQAPDGMRVHDALVFQAAQTSQMVGDAELTQGIESLAKDLTALVHAPKGEDYSGPVLFEGEAGPQIFAEILGENLGLTRRPVTEPRRNASIFPSELEGRIGARILPEFFDVVDDPTQKQWKGRPLFGSYEVDREGVVPAPLRLVEKGVLKDYLLTRQPVRGHDVSNGRARMPGSFGASTAGISNLIVTAAETTPRAEMRKKMMDMINMRGKPYGIIVRKMDFPWSGSVPELRNLFGSQTGSSRPVSLPVLVYKVYPDGREELVRGMRFRGLNARSFKDVMAAGDDPTVFEFMDNAAPLALMGGGGYVSNAAVIAPSILIDDLEMYPVEDETPRLPVVPAPQLVR